MFKSSASVQRQGSGYVTPARSHNQLFQPRPFAPIEDSEPTTEVVKPLTGSLLARLVPSPVPPPPAPVQTKLAIGQPNDQYEQEADQVAEQVMRMPDPAPPPPVQKKGSSGDEEETLQSQPINISSVTSSSLQQKCSTCEQEGQVQRSGDGQAEVGSDIESRLSSSQGGGSPLPQDVKGFMESRFRTDFSQVRVHTDGEAVQMNRDLNAQAFTHKQDVYFGAGKTPGRDALTAHELTHVVQQTGAIQTKYNPEQPTVQMKCAACEKEDAEVQRLPIMLADDANTLGEGLYGAPSACVLNAALPYARSGILRGLGGTVGERFQVQAEWSSTPKSSRGETSYCAAECGEYHQFIKGHMLASPNKDGSNLADVSGNLFGGQKLDENSFQEDGLDRNPNARYGHRDEPQTMDEEYKPSRTTGPKYFGRDFPNVSIGTFADIDLTFLGKLVDICNSKENQSATWRVQYRGVIRP